MPGLKVVYADPTKPEAIPAGSFDVVYDNNGKDMANCKGLIDAFKVGGRCELLAGGQPVV